jgi:hypothetical protein
LHHEGRWSWSAEDDAGWFAYLLSFDWLDTRQRAWGDFYVDPQLRRR